MMGVTLWLVSKTVGDALRTSLRKRGEQLARSLVVDTTVFNDNVRAPSTIGAATVNAGEFVLLLGPDLEQKQATSGIDTVNQFAPTVALLKTCLSDGPDTPSECVREGGKTKGGLVASMLPFGNGLFVWAASAVDQRRNPDTGELEPVFIGYSVVALSDSENQRVMDDVLIVLGSATVLFLVVFLGVIYWISRHLIIRPLAGMMTVARKMSDCDLTEPLPAEGGEEFAELGRALGRTSGNLRQTLSRVKGVSEGITTVIDQISHTSEVVAKGALTTAQSVDETSSSMEEMIASLKGIAENVEVLAQSAEESSSSILEMAATNDEVAENIQGLAGSVEETTAAIEQMTFSIKQVAKNIEELSATAEETSSSMNEMDVSIGQVEMNANETARLSELVSQDAETGTKALQKTIVGIDKIKESSKEAATVIESLGRKIGTIGNILNVIDDVAEQTNLLALNAAIIAAQAGEHGKGFAVVADEIKDLAERTGASTKEISQLIRGVQDESKNAVLAMERGVKNVEEGVRLGGEAEGALKKINESAGKATQMVKAIARATVEQARGSKQVTNAINRIAETVVQIAKATAEQAKGSEHIMQSAERMKDITKHVERSSQEQARGSKQITRSIENINEMVSHLNRAQKEQTKGSEQVMKAVESIKGVVDQQNRSMRELETAIDQLARQADVLKEEARRFRV